MYFATEDEKTAELLEALAGSEEAAGKGTATQGRRKRHDGKVKRQSFTRVSGRKYLSQWLSAQDMVQSPPPPPQSQAKSAEESLPLSH